MRSKNSKRNKKIDKSISNHKEIKNNAVLHKPKNNIEILLPRQKNSEEESKMPEDSKIPEERLKWSICSWLCKCFTKRVTEPVRTSKLTKGLDNFGSTCYINSVLQILLNTEEFISALSSPRGDLGKNLISLMKSENPATRAKYLSDFLRLVSKIDKKWGDGHQRDSKEFFLSLLSSIYNEGDEEASKVFYLWRKSTYLMECNHIVENSQNVGFLNAGNKTVEEFTEKFLAKFTDPQKSGETFEFYCRECEKTKFCTEERIVKLPKILGIYFDNNVKQTLDLNKFEFIRTDLYKFRLCGVIQRLELGEQVGHFRTFFMINSQWQLFDDKKVSDYKKSYVKSAYMVFYRLVDRDN